MKFSYKNSITGSVLLNKPARGIFGLRSLWQRSFMTKCCNVAANSLLLNATQPPRATSILKSYPKSLNPSQIKMTELCCSQASCNRHTDYQRNGLPTPQNGPPIMRRPIFEFDLRSKYLKFCHYFFKYLLMDDVIMSERKNLFQLMQFSPAPHFAWTCQLAISCKKYAMLEVSFNRHLISWTNRQL